MYDEKTIIKRVKRQIWSNEVVNCSIGEEILYWDGESGYDGGSFEFEKGIVVEVDNEKGGIIIKGQEEGFRCWMPMYYVKKVNWI